MGTAIVFKVDSDLANMGRVGFAFQGVGLDIVSFRLESTEAMLDHFL